MKRITNVGQHLACARCGLEAEIGKGDMKACVHCGGMVFVPYRYLPWDAALTQFDLDFLKCNRISPA